MTVHYVEGAGVYGQNGADDAAMDAVLGEDHEIPAILHALDGGYIRPVPGGDLLRNPEVLPTGRNLHGFDPFRIPSAFAVQHGTRQYRCGAARFRIRTTMRGRAMPRLSPRWTSAIPRLSRRNPDAVTAAGLKSSSSMRRW